MNVSCQAFVVQSCQTRQMEKGEEKTLYLGALLTSLVTRGTRWKVLKAEFVKQTEHGVAIELSVPVSNLFDASISIMQAVLIIVSMGASLFIFMNY